MESASARILVVDDSQDDVCLLSERLAQMDPDLEVVHVDNAASMKTVLRDQMFDLIISDHSMPSFDSGAALRIARESGREVPLVIYSGLLGQDQGVSAMKFGARDFVGKDCPERLIAVVQRELQHTRLSRDKARAEESARQLAHFDELTGLPNRTLFCERLAAKLDSTPPAPGALLYIDLDRFMRINDSFGYPAGDALMCQIAARLQRCVDESDLVARLGQDEFVLYAGGIADACGALSLAERVMQRLAPGFMQNGQEFFLTASIGIGLYPEHGGDVHGLMKNAEAAMFAVKKQGRNQARLYQRELNRSSGHRLRLENDLRRAIANEQFHLVFQPIYDLHSARVVSAEALLRWKHPELGNIPPDQFIFIADETGLIRDIGDWVIRQACAQLGQWRREGLDELSIAVNVSAAQFRGSNLSESVSRVLQDTGLQASRLEIEITETVAMQSGEEVMEELRRLKAIGVRISIDDFGTGYSSLAYLKRFPVDTLKIDRSFVSDITSDAGEAPIVDAIASLGRALRLDVLAEGVETAGQFAYLSQHGCRYLQGYYIGKPVESTHFPEMIARVTRARFALPQTAVAA
ncbi:MAG: EAL domain-containing protein [Burkholderiales bacterium]|nr:EAL domain-containing protein [Burkholderiales bacterium]